MTTWTVSEPRHIELGDEPITRLDVRLTSGRLSVVATDGPPRIEISRTSEVPVQVEASGGVLRVAHDTVRTWPGPLGPLWWWINGGRKFATDISIAVPAGTLAKLWVASGSVVASGLHADVDADCVNGRITVFGIVGSLRAKVISGPIEALGCAGRVELETVSGEITLADTTAERVRAKTISGAVVADLDNPPRDCDIQLDTVSGEITIRIREDSDLSVALAAAHGRVTSEFPGLSGRGMWGSSAAGVLGAGRGRLAANAVGGSIALLRRPVDADFDGDAGPDAGTDEDDRS